jgi:D-alanine-D-alanine ligase-like ATP-grasp enzyme
MLIVRSSILFGDHLGNSMKMQTSLPDIGVLLKKIAPKVGARVLLEPKWKVVGQVSYPSGQKRYFRLSSLDLNPMGASAVAKDKDYANFFMTRLGYPTVKGKAFFSRDWAKAMRSKDNIDAAYRYAKKLGLPVIVKPNSGTRGQSVSLVHTRMEFYRAMRQIFLKDPVALVQRQLAGKDYRIVVLDNEVISAYERTPLSVIGDGKSSIRNLLKKKQAKFRRINRDTVINAQDPRISSKLRRQKLTLDSVIPKAVAARLLDNANLSSGGDSLDVTDAIHPVYRSMAIRLTRDMGLRLCGVDIMIDGDISEPHKDFYVLEINSAPGLDHYARSGTAQKKIVESLYLKVLARMEGLSSFPKDND